MKNETNGFEKYGRERKAFAISLSLWRLVPPEHRTRTDLGASLTSLPQDERNAVARRAAKNNPSEKTWTRVCSMIDEKAAEERRFLGLLDDERAAS